MIFSGGLAVKVLDGSKTQTRRPTKRAESDGRLLPCTYRVGTHYAVQERRGGFAMGRIRILAVDRVSTFPISWTDAVAEGFASPAAFESKWIELYGANGPGECWRIEVEVVQ